MCEGSFSSSLTCSYYSNSTTLFLLRSFLYPTEAAKRQAQSHQQRQAQSKHNAKSNAKTSAALLATKRVINDAHNARGGKIDAELTLDAVQRIAYHLVLEVLTIVGDNHFYIAAGCAHGIKDEVFGFSTLRGNSKPLVHRRKIGGVSYSTLQPTIPTTVIWSNVLVTRSCMHSASQSGSGPEPEVSIMARMGQFSPSTSR